MAFKRSAVRSRKPLFYFHLYLKKLALCSSIRNSANSRFKNTDTLPLLYR